MNLTYFHIITQHKYIHYNIFSQIFITCFAIIQNIHYTYIIWCNKYKNKTKLDEKKKDNENDKKEKKTSSSNVYIERILN